MRKKILINCLFIGCFAFNFILLDKLHKMLTHSKIPKVEGTVYRGMNVSEDVAKKMIKSKNMTLKQITSTSKKRSVAVEFADDFGGGMDVEVIMKMHVKRGVDFSGVNTTEAEVLLIRGQKFRVIEVTSKNARRFDGSVGLDKVFITLEEVL